jgi:hypothetical protein
MLMIVRSCPIHSVKGQGEQADSGSPDHEGDDILPIDHGPTLGLRGMRTLLPSNTNSSAIRAMIVSAMANRTVSDIPLSRFALLF